MGKFGLPNLRINRCETIERFQNRILFLITPPKNISNYSCESMYTAILFYRIITPVPMRRFGFIHGKERGYLAPFPIPKETKKLFFITELPNIFVTLRLY